MPGPAPATARASAASWWQTFREERLWFLDQPWKLVPLWAMVPWLVFYLWFVIYAWRARGDSLFIDAVNMVTHEAGHPLFGYFGETLHLWGGTILQLLVPAALALTFVRMRELMGTTFCWFLFFENFLGIAVYMADARAQNLPLISAEGGGEGDIIHDWGAIFGQLGLLPYDIKIAAAVRLLGFAGMVAVPVWFAWRGRQTQKDN
jgi:hypothetical protein